MDYRDLAGSGERFDAIASIGMVEHVGASQIEVYARDPGERAGAGRAPAQPRDHPAAPQRLRGRRLLGALRLPRCRAAAPLAQPAGARTGRLRHPPRRGLRRRLRRDAAPLGAPTSTTTSTRRSGSPARNGCGSGGSTCAPPATASTTASPRSTRHAAGSAESPVIDGTLLAISDLHVDHAENRRSSKGLRRSDRDGLADRLRRRRRLARGRRVGAGAARGAVREGDLGARQPRAADPARRRRRAARGGFRYRSWSRRCRRLGVLTPEDPYPVWEGPGGPALVAPLFLLYDYSFGANVGADQGGVAAAGARGRCRLRRRVPAPPRPLPEPRGVVRGSGARRPRRGSTELPAGLPTVLVNHFPLHREADADPAPPRVRPVVRDAADRRLAPSLRGGASSSTGTSTFPSRPGRTGSGSRRSRSATRASRGRREWARPGLRRILPERSAA